MDMKYIIHTAPHFVGVWTAVLDDYDGADIDAETGSPDPVGLGLTEADAIKDLLERIEERK